MRHLRRDWNSTIQDTDERSGIASDEPVLVLHASDPDAYMTARVYAAYKHNRLMAGRQPDDADLAIVRAYQWWADQMREWAAEHVGDTDGKRTFEAVDESMLDAPRDVLHPVIGEGVPRELIGAQVPPVPLPGGDASATLRHRYGPPPEVVRVLLANEQAPAPDQETVPSST